MVADPLDAVVGQLSTMTHLLLPSLSLTGSVIITNPGSISDAFC